MKQEYKHIDDLLRDSLNGYSREPSPGLWSKVAAGIFLRSKGFYLSLFILFLTSGLFMFMGSNQEQTSVQANPLPKSHGATASRTIGNRINANGPDGKDENQSVSIVASTNTGVNVNPQTLTATQPENSSITQQASVLQVFPENIQEENSPGKTNPSVDYFSHYPGLERLGDKSIKGPGVMPHQHMGFSHLYPNFIPPRSEFYWPERTTDYGFNKSNLILFQITPEVIFSGDDRKQKNYSLNTDLFYVREGKDGFLQAGIGLGITEDDGIFNIDYTQYDSLGYYEQVNSFSIDQNTGQPVFNTSTEGVFDTIAYNQSEINRNLYYYFRIPVRAGLKFYEIKRLAFYAQIGGTYSVLMKKHEPETSFSNDAATWYEITNQTPVRVQSNVQLTMGIGIKYKLSNRFDLRFDGLYNYYWNAMVEKQNSNKTPFSLGLGIGILFKL